MDNALRLIVAAASLHVIVLLIPGPDFALVSSSALISSKKTARLNTLGIGIGVIVEVTLAILGLSVLVARDSTLFNAIKFTGGIYLLWLSYTYIKSPGYNVASVSRGTQSNQNSPLIKGLLTELSNPKALLFVITVFSVVLNAKTSFVIRLIVGFNIVAVTTIYYWTIASVISQKRLNTYLRKYQRRMSLITAVILVYFGLSLLWWAIR
jgi:threonine efflux protein